MLTLWFEEGIEEAKEEIQKNNSRKERKQCACGRTVCCGKHKSGQCSCQKKQKERS